MGVQYNYGVLDDLARNGIGELMQQAQGRQTQAAQVNQQMEGQKLTRDKLQADLDSERTASAWTMIASVAKLPEEKQAGTYQALKGTIQAKNPSLQLPDQWDAGLGQYAVNQAIGPKGLAELDMSRQKMNDSAAYREMMLGFQQQKVDAGPKAPSGYRYGDDGVSLEPIPGGPGDPTTKPPTEYQGKLGIFANRMAQAEPTIEELKDANSLTKKTLAAVPVAGNFLAGDDYQRLDQAKRNFINAVLRQESGAAIGQSEFDNAERQYFPQPGDGADVIEQKRQNRALAAAEMAKAAGPAFRPNTLAAPPAGKGANATPTPPDPRVQQALEAGYSMDEINAYLTNRK